MNIPPPPPTSLMLGNSIPPPPPDSSQLSSDSDIDLAQPEESNPDSATGFMQGLLTNKPTSGIPAMIGRIAPQMIGGTIGALGGSGIASIPTAALGGAAGEAIRQDLVSASQGSNTLKSILANTGLAAASQGVGQGVNTGLGAMLGSNAVLTAGAQAIRAMDATPENLAAAAIKNPDLIKQGMDIAKDNLASKGYQAFEQYTGLKGLDQLAGERGTPWTANELYSLATNTANQVKNGAEVSQQELYAASQAQNQLSRLARFGNPDAAAMKGSNSLMKAGQTVDKALEEQLPEYASLRNDRFLQSMGERFSSFFPLNKDGSVNSLRTFGALGYAINNAGKAAMGAGLGYHEYGAPGAAAGAIAGLAAPLVISPYMAGLGIRAGSTLLNSQIPQTAVRGAIASLIPNYQANPTQDTTPSSPLGMQQRINQINNPFKQ